MNRAALITRPELTMPEAEANLVRAAYARAEVILEYGSGGSTVMAGEMAGKRIFSVESDKGWAKGMEAWFAANPPQSPVEIVHADIGATKEWGHPVDESGWRRFADYPLGIWESGRMGQPDVVLVDGRFRTGCALATAFHTRRRIPLLFDDYVQRTHYHKVEELLGAPEIVGRMALFEVAPMAVPAERLSWVIRAMGQP